MASWTAPTIFATGDLLDVNSANAWSNDLTFLYEAPYGVYYNSTSTSCANGAQTALSLTLSAQGYGFSLSSNAVSVPLTGMYLCTFNITVSGGVGSGSDWAGSLVQLNGTTTIQGAQDVAQAVFPAYPGGGILTASAADTLTLICNNQSSATLNTVAGAANSFLNAVFLGSQ